MHFFFKGKIDTFAKGLLPGPPASLRPLPGQNLLKPVVPEELPVSEHAAQSRWGRKELNPFIISQVKFRKRNLLLTETWDCCEPRLGRTGFFSQSETHSSGHWNDLTLSPCTDTCQQEKDTRVAGSATFVAVSRQDSSKRRPGQYCHGWKVEQRTQKGVRKATTHLGTLVSSTWGT